MNNKIFYILENSSRPKYYYTDSWLEITDDVLIAKRFSTPEEALNRMREPSKWKVCVVHLDIKYV